MERLESPGGSSISACKSTEQTELPSGGQQGSSGDDSLSDTAFIPVALVIQQCSFSEAGWLIIKLRQLAGTMPLLSLEVRGAQVGQTRADGRGWVLLSNRQLLGHEIWELASPCLRSPLELRATSVFGRTSIQGQSIHLFDPLDHAAASAPVIMLHFGTCNDERAISDCEMSRRSQDSAECVPLEPPLDSHLLTEGTEQAAKERHASTSFNQPGDPNSGWVGSDAYEQTAVLHAMEESELQVALDEVFSCRPGETSDESLDFHGDLYDLEECSEPDDLGQDTAQNASSNLFLNTADSTSPFLLANFDSSAVPCTDPWPASCLQ
ncbi:hypothetical protein WJX84_009394 [Apatococcus fuscideae]|uniref:Uncharacterized protein n=1 Tax=Apatococcus fuscideae TaxID=2026836 RepID=A0AAW1T979_9CHLO